MQKILFILLWPLRFGALKLSNWLIEDSNLQKGGGKMEIVILCVCAILTALKLLGILAWSWWWVFSPLWLPIVLYLCFVSVILLFGFIAHVTKKRNDDE